MKKCIVVIGMHRSGTSMITKALETLGVHLGEQLLPAAEDNQKGFYEDKSIVDLNDRILEYAGMTWYSVSEYPFSVLESEQGRAFEKEAMEIISSRLRTHPVWGFKDPRCSRLLPFWQSIFAKLDIEAEYLVVLRNPLDIAFSLKKRNDFKLNMCQHLWLAHSFMCLRLLKNKNICYVSYDNFLKDPKKHIEYLSNTFHLPMEEKSMDAFVKDVVSSDLRHKHSTIDDLAAHPGVFPFVVKLYKILDNIVNDSLTLECVLEQWDELEREYLQATHASLHEFCLHAHTRNVDVENLTDLLTKRSITITKQKQFLAKYSSTIAKQQLFIDKQIIEQARLKHENARLEKSYTLISQSSTWKITKPLRNVVARIKGKETNRVETCEAPSPRSDKKFKDKYRKSDSSKVEQDELVSKVQGKQRSTWISLKQKLNNATAYNEKVYDLIRAQGRRGTVVGKMANFGLKAGYKYIKIIKRLRPSGPAAIQRASVNERVELVNEKVELFPWLKPLNPISTDKGQRILIIAEVSLPQCYKYRVNQKVEMFEHLNYDVKVVSWNNYAQARLALQTHGMVIFYRVPAFPEVKMLLAECERLDLETIFDVDDLIFDMKEYSQNSNIISLPPKEKAELLNGAKLYRSTLEHCRHAIASTPGIARFMKKYCRGQIYILENCLDRQMYRIEKLAREDSPMKNPDDVIIGYGSGTTTHDVDFEQCAAALLKVLEIYPHVKLAIHGHLKLPGAFQAFRSRIFRVPFLQADDYFMALAGFDINLAPLEDTLFNDAKSNIKFIEASMFCVPTIASPGTAFNQVVIHGENGLLCSSPDEWVKALSTLIEDENLRETMGKNARETAVSLYDYREVAKKQLMQIVKKHLPSRKKNKRILVVNILFSPIAFGGATIVTEELARLINQDPGMDVTIFTGFWDDGDTGIPSEEIVRYEAMGMPVFAVRFPKVMTPELEFRNYKIADQFKSVLKCVQPDLVHFHSIQQLGASLAEPCQDMGIPYVITLHDTWWICERQFMIMGDGVYCDQCPVDLRYCVSYCTPDSAHTFARNFYLRRILNNSAMLITPSKFQKDFYVANGFERKRIKINKNGVMPPAWGGINKVDAKVRFAFLGGNARHKGYDWLKQVFESIDLDGYSLHLADCQRKIGQPSIKASDWKIKGELIISDGFDQTTIDEFFAHMDVLLFPSQWKESFGLTIREALVRDIWVIATDSGGTVEDIIPGENGQVFARNDVKGFRQAVIDTIENPRDLINPYKDEIRLFPEQAQELRNLYNELL